MSCKSIEKSGLGEKEIDLYNQQICTSYDHNQLGEFKCKECDDTLCQKCHKSHSKLKVTRNHNFAVHEGKKLYKCRICDN